MGILFSVLDVDNTGYITKDNLDSIAQQSGLTDQAGQDKVDEVFSSLDADDSGQVSFQDFMDAIFDGIE